MSGASATLPTRPAALSRGALRAGLAAALLAATLSVAPAPSLAQGSRGGQDGVNEATIQWAQQILDAKNLYQGRATGKMDAATASAIAAYQKQVGLKATGRLDKATIDRMLAERQEKQDPTVGNLADPKSRAKPSSPILREEDVRPQAAPSVAGVERDGGGETAVLGAARVPAGPAAAGEPRPSAAPATRVDAPVAGMDQPAAAPVTRVEAEGQDAGFQIGSFVPPDWLRYGLIGGTALLVLGMAFAWWMGGRRRVKPAARKAPAASAPVAGPVRREPSLGPAAPQGRQAPTFAAPPRPGSGLRAGR